MSLLKGMTPEVKKLPCAIRTVFEAIETEDADILQAAIADENLWAAETLARALGNRGIKVSGKSISKHRRNECSC
jgi:plasmid stability protein